MGICPQQGPPCCSQAASRKHSKHGDNLISTSHADPPPYPRKPPLDIRVTTTRGQEVITVTIPTPSRERAVNMTVSLPAAGDTIMVLMDSQSSLPQPCTRMRLPDSAQDTQDHHDIGLIQISGHAGNEAVHAAVGARTLHGPLPRQDKRCLMHPRRNVCSSAPTFLPIIGKEGTPSPPHTQV